MYKRIMLRLRLCFSIEYTENNLTDFIQILHVYVTGHSFFGWNHISDFEIEYGERDWSIKNWKGKHTRKNAKVSVEMPPNDNDD